VSLTEVDFSNAVKLDGLLVKYSEDDSAINLTQAVQFQKRETLLPVCLIWGILGVLLIRLLQFFLV